MSTNKRSITGYIVIFLSIVLIVLSFFIENIEILILGIIMFVVSVILTLIFNALELFRRDKILDIENLKKQGFTIVKCSLCNKDNVIEDKYCIHCGEKLVNIDEEI